jgi:hypothetical protein
LISRTLEEPTTCKSGAPTPAGSRYSSIKMVNSSIGQTTKYLMSQDPKMKKDKLLVLLETLENQIRNGKFFILTKLKRPRLRD